MIVVSRFLNIHISQENQLMQDRQDPNYDGLWKIRQVFYILNAKFSELYHVTEHVAVGNIIKKFRGEIVFQQYIQKKTKKQIFLIQIYKHSKESGYMYNISVYL
jgi:hypothetical protein